MTALTRRSLLTLSFLAACGVAFATPQIGQPAPDFTLPASDGKSVTLDSFQGKYVVLEWFNPECPFVHKHYDSGNMQALQKTWTNKGVVWLSIDSSAPGKEGYIDAAGAEKVRGEMKSNATALLLDPDGAVGRLYQAKTTPDMFVINPVGKLVYMGAIDDRPSVDTADIPGSTNYVSRALQQAMTGKDITDSVTKPYGCSVKYH